MALLPASQVATFVHLGTVRHTTCPEHGELVEAGPAPHVETPAPAHSVAPAAPAAPERHDHDHCLFACHLRQGAERATAVVASVLPLDRAATACAPSAAPRAGPAPLSVAPKQSPPFV